MINEWQGLHPHHARYREEAMRLRDEAIEPMGEARNISDGRGGVQGVAVVADIGGGLGEATQGGSECPKQIHQRELLFLRYRPLRDFGSATV